MDNVTKPGLDVYPPSQVRDLKVVSINVNQMTLTIEWTATGDDLDKGTGAYIIIAYFHIFTSIRLIFYCSQSLLMKSNIHPSLAT